MNNEEIYKLYRAQDKYLKFSDFIENCIEFTYEDDYDDLYKGLRMDKKQIQSLITEKLEGINLKDIGLYFEDNSVLRVEVVSNDFIGVRLLKRIEALSQKLVDLSMNELFEYQLIFNPLTSNEKVHGSE